MRLSIVTINYNNKAGLQKTIDSILCQVWRDYEWIIIDGGSSDGSRELIESIASNKNSQISYWCSESDKGIFNAMNKGIQHCNGDYVIFMNSGDEFYSPDSISDVFNKNINADIIFGDAMLVQDGIDIGVARTPHADEFYGLYRRNICHQAMFMKTSILKKEGFNESYKYVSDYKRYVDAALQGSDFKYVNTIICRFDISGTTSAQRKNVESEEDRLKSELPPSVKKSLDRLSFYENHHQVNRLKAIINKGGVALFVTNIFLKLIDKLFIPKNLSKRDFDR